MKDDTGSEVVLCDVSKQTEDEYVLARVKSVGDKRLADVIGGGGHLSMMHLEVMLRAEYGTLRVEHLENLVDILSIRLEGAREAVRGLFRKIHNETEAVIYELSEREIERQFNIVNAKRGASEG